MSNGEYHLYNCDKCGKRHDWRSDCKTSDIEEYSKRIAEAQKFQQGKEVTTTTPHDAEFMKFDNQKIAGYHLIPREAMDAMAQVLDYGAKKYSPNNWKQCDDISRYQDALWRHILAYLDGEEVDVESGLPHLAHAITNLSFLIWFAQRELNNIKES